MNNEITIRCDCDGEKTERLLRRILHQIEDIYMTLDSFDELSDIVEDMDNLTERVRQIG